MKILKWEEGAGMAGICQAFTCPVLERVIWWWGVCGGYRREGGRRRGLFVCFGLETLQRKKRKILVLTVSTDFCITGN